MAFHERRSSCGFLEVTENFPDVAAMKSLSFKICQILEFHPTHHNDVTFKRFRKLFKNTFAKMSSRSDDPDTKWSYFDDLAPGGKLFRSDLLSASSKIGKMLERMKKSLDSPEGLENSRTCNNCFLLSDVFCCQGCFFVFYCSRSCQDTHWAQSHENECKAMSDILVQEAAKMPPDELSGVHRGKHKANIQRIYLLKKKNSELATELNRREEDLKYLEECKDKDARIISECKVENEVFKAQIAKV